MIQGGEHTLLLPVGHHSMTTLTKEYMFSLRKYVPGVNKGHGKVSSQESTRTKILRMVHLKKAKRTFEKYNSQNWNYGHTQECAYDCFRVCFGLSLVGAAEYAWVCFWVSMC